MYKLGWFSTGRGKGSQGLLKAVQDSIKTGEINAEIEFVFCSREHGETEATDTFLKMVEDYHLPLVTCSYRNYKAGRADTDTEGNLASWRLDYDREVMKRLQGCQPDLCVLAGYMLIAGKEMCRKYNLLNLHPAAPWGPAGTWPEVIWRLIETKATETGVMMHLATPELDEGPVATYCTFPIRGEPFDGYWEEITGQSLEKIKKEPGSNNNLFRHIREHGYAREIPLIKATIQAFSQGRVSITADKKVVDAGGNIIKGYDLSEEINELVKEILLQ